MNLFSIVNRWDNVLYSIYNTYARFKYLISYPKIHSIVGRNKVYKGIHKGCRCFIVLNGPSIKNHDLKILRGEYVFCANYMYKSNIVDTIQPNYYCWMDSLIFTNPEEGKETIRELQIKCPNSELFLNYKAYNVVDKNSRIHFTYNMHMPSTSGGKYTINGLSSGYTNVLGYVLGIAFYMGFSEINILGLDFEPTGFRHFDDDVDGTDRQEARKYESITHYGSILKAHCEFIGAEYYAKRHNITIRNLNPDSYVRAFDFSTLKSIFPEIEETSNTCKNLKSL